MRLTAARIAADMNGSFQRLAGIECTPELLVMAACWRWAG